MKKITEAISATDFIKQYTALQKYVKNADPMILLSEIQDMPYEKTLTEFIRTSGLPLLTYPMIPQYRTMELDPELPIIYTSLTPGGTMTIYTTLPVQMSQGDAINLAEKLGINRVHWVLLQHMDYEGIVDKLTSRPQLAEEVIVPEDVWSKFIENQILPGEISEMSLGDKIQALRKAGGASLPGGHPMSYPAKTILSQYPVLSSTTIEQNDRLLQQFNTKTITYYNICPISICGNNVVLGVSQHIDAQTKQAIKTQLLNSHIKFQYILLPQLELQRLITQINVSITTQQITLSANYGYTEDEDIDYADYKIDPEEVEKAASAEDVVSAQTFLDALLMRAIHENASDIHLSLRNNTLRIRFRINGILKEVQDKPIPLELSRQILARIQVVAQIDTQRKEVPQDGQFKFKLKELPCEVRVNSSENINGLHIVMRLQVPNSELSNLETLGLDPYELKVIQEAISADNGLMIICGPTGSGKSTTLYAALKAIDRVKYNVLTAEQPVERRIPNVEQTNIIKGSKYTFAEFIVAAMRQDPDYILIGETRDKETAQEIVRAAITGHVVLTTLHTNSAALAPARLIDLTHEPMLLADATNALCAQRLLPKLCPYCMRKREIPSVATLRAAGIKEEWLMGASHFFESVGCPHCNYTGRVTRTCIMEGFIVNQEIKELIGRGAPAREIAKAQAALGSKSLYEKAVRKVAQGEIALEDALPLKLTAIN